MSELNWLDRILASDPWIRTAKADEEPGRNGSGEKGPERVFDPTLEVRCAGLSVDEARELREERAAILEYEGGFTKAEAERRAGLVNAGILSAA